MDNAFFSVNAIAARAAVDTAAAEGSPRFTTAGTGPEAEGFSALFSAAVTKLNETSAAAKRAAEGFEQGQNDDLAQVMIAQQRARIHFQAALQVRNQLVSGFQDLMNMPI